MNPGWTEGFGLPDNPTAARIDVATPTYVRPVNATLLTATLYQRRKHWDGTVGRPVPCSRPALCVYCDRLMESYRTGFIASCWTRGRRPCIVQLSDAAIVSLEAWALAHPQLRGLAVVTTRRDARANAKMVLSVLGQDEGPGLPPEFDPRPTLEQMWGLAAARDLSPETLGLPEKRTRRRAQGGR